MIDGLSRGLLVSAPAKHPWSQGRVTTPDTRNINRYYCSPSQDQPRWLGFLLAGRLQVGRILVAVVSIPGKYLVHGTDRARNAVPRGSTTWCNLQVATLLIGIGGGDNS